MHACISPCMHACIPPYMYVCMHGCARACMHACMHACVHPAPFSSNTIVRTSAMNPANSRQGWHPWHSERTCCMSACGGGAASRTGTATHHCAMLQVCRRRSRGRPGLRTSKAFNDCRNITAPRPTQLGRGHSCHHLARKAHACEKRLLASVASCCCACAHVSLCVCCNICTNAACIHVCECVSERERERKRELRPPKLRALGVSVVRLFRADNPRFPGL